MLVAELTLPSQQLYLRARVAHITGMAVDGTYQFQVGCEFFGRVEFLGCPLRSGNGVVSVICVTYYRVPAAKFYGIDLSQSPAV